MTPLYSVLLLLLLDSVHNSQLHATIVLLLSTSSQVACTAQSSTFCLPVKMPIFFFSSSYPDLTSLWEMSNWLFVMGGAIWHTLSIHKHTRGLSYKFIFYIKKKYTFIYLLQMSSEKGTCFVVWCPLFCQKEIQPKRIRTINKSFVKVTRNRRRRRHCRRWMVWLCARSSVPRICYRKTCSKHIQTDQSIYTYIAAYINVLLLHDKWATERKREDYFFIIMQEKNRQSAHCLCPGETDYKFYLTPIYIYFFLVTKSFFFFFLQIEILKTAVSLVRVVV